MNDAIDDLLILVNEIVSGVGAEKVASSMENDFGWVKIDPAKIAEVVENYLRNDVFEDELDDVMSTLYAEFYNLADDFDYEITTTY